MTKGTTVFVFAAAAAFVALFALLPRPALPHAATSNTVLFDREIVRILNARCVMCHHEGGPAVALETYEQVWLNRNAIHDEVLARQMPLWAAVPGYGEFSNENRLTLREMRFIVSWVEGLGPRNAGNVFLNVLDPAAPPPAVVRAAFDADVWRAGEPDAVFDVPAGERVAGSNAPLTVLRSRVEIDASSDQWIDALEFHPADRRYVRAVELTIAATGQWLATWTPWHGMHRLPESVAYRLPAGSTIQADVFVADGAPVSAGVSTLGIHFAADAQPTTADELVLEVDGVSAGGADSVGRTLRQRLAATQVLDRNVSVLALWPELPAGTQSIEVRARRPDGAVEILLLAGDIPVDWPTPYILETPVVLPRGTELGLIVYVDNADGGAITERVRLAASVY